MALNGRVDVFHNRVERVDYCDVFTEDLLSSVKFT